MNSLISVIIPVYNTSECLRRCLDSVLNQSYENLEFIILNDGSTDGSSEICREYKSRYPFINYVEKINEGIAITRNLGLQLAKGEYICFVDSDDYIELDMIKVLAQELTNQEAELCICGCVQEFESGSKHIIDLESCKFIKKNEALEKLCLNIEVHSYLWGCIIKKSLFEEVIFEPNRNYEDLSTVYKLYIKAKKIAFVTLPLYHYMIRSTDSITSDKSLSKLMVVFEILVERKNNVLNYDSKMKNACDFSIYQNIMDILYRLHLGNIQEPAKEYELCTYLNGIKKDILKNPYFSKKDKFIVFCVLHYRYAYFKLYKYLRGKCFESEQ